MQDFLKEWGPAIVTAVVIILLIAIVRFIAPSIRKGMEGVVTQFGNNTKIGNDDADKVVQDDKTGSGESESE